MLKSPFFEDESVSTPSEFNSVLVAVKSSITILFTSVMFAWTLDMITRYTISNVVYGLAISGSAGLIATGTDVAEGNRRFIDTETLREHPDLSNMTRRIVGLFALAVGLYLQLLALFVTEMDFSNWLPTIEIQYVNWLYWFTVGVFLFVSSLTHFVKLLLEAVLFTVGLFSLFYTVKLVFGMRWAIITSLSSVVTLQAGLLLVWFGGMGYRTAKRLISATRSPHKAEERTKT